GPQLRAGLDLAGAQVSVGEDEYIASHMSDEDLRQFVTAESLILHSHASETLLRLFIAHEGRPGCPWLVMANLGMHRFWEIAESLSSPAWSPSMRAVTADLLLGGAERPSDHPIPASEWEEVLDRLCAWIAHLASALRTNRHNYNAAKHGFAAKASTTLAQFLEADTNTAVIGHEGPSIEALTHDGWNLDGERVWSLSTRWYDPPTLWAETDMAIRLIETVWSLGRSRYCAGEPASLRVPSLTPGELSHPHGITHWSETVLIQQRPPTYPASM
ncbi:MAG: hypothetical protein MUE34_07000, partial [Acidimicrobiales bacterium]|nr:hypothetical protein [Acidimicrobiales bacterium]